MASFSFGEITPKHIGLYLRWGHSPNLIRLIRKSTPFFYSVETVKVVGYDVFKKLVQLEVRSRRWFTWSFHRVHYLNIPVDPDWSVEANFGPGEHFFDKPDAEDLSIARWIFLLENNRTPSDSKEDTDLINTYAEISEKIRKYNQYPGKHYVES